jgi:DHA1 family tetracycline resistance protein-like MFS transporter
MIELCLIARAGRLAYHRAMMLKRVFQARIAGETPSSAGLPVLLFVMFITNLGFGLIVPILPLYARAFDAQPWQVALVFSAFSIGSFVGEPFWGRLSDRIGRRPVLISTLMCNCVCFGLMAFAPSIEAAVLIRLFGGLFAGNGSVVQSYITDVTPPEQRAGKLSLIGVAYNLGFIAGPVIGGLLAHPELGPRGFRAPFEFASALGLLAAVLVSLLVRESNAEPGAHGRASPVAVLAQAVRHPVAAPLLGVTFVCAFSLTAIQSIFGLWGHLRFDWNPRQIGMIFAFSGIAGATAQWFFLRRLARRFGEARTLAAGLVLAIASQLAIPMGHGFASVGMLMASAAFGQSFVFPNVAALMSRITSPRRQGQVMGLNNAMGAAARICGPLASGLSLAGFGLSAPFYLACIVVAPAIGLALLADRRLKQAPLL